MQFFGLIVIYFLAGLNFEVGKKKKATVVTRQGLIKRVLKKFFLGFSALFIADFFSFGEPLWPGLALVVLTVGVVFPYTNNPGSLNTLLYLYGGGIFYMFPVQTIVAVLILLPNLLLGKEFLILGLTYVSVIPVLLYYTQVNRVFFWCSLLVIGLVFWQNRHECLNRFRETCGKIFTRQEES